MPHTQFDWEVGELDEDAGLSRDHPLSRLKPGNFWFLVAAAVLVLILLVSWQSGRARLAREERQLRRQVQAILDLEHRSYLAGDGDLFFSTQSADPAWISAQLRPENQLVSGAGLQAVRVLAQDNRIRACVTWQSGDHHLQRLAFYEWQSGQLRRMPSDAAYWGEWVRETYSWGDLVSHEVDVVWRTEVAAYISHVVSRLCAAGCLEERQPLVVTLASDFADTAAAHEIRLPSPRLLALTATGQPAPLFWDQLKQRLEAYLRPAVIRFAVPPTGVYELQLRSDYSRAADRFMALHPEIVVEIIKLDEPPDDLASLAVEYDGAAAVPTEAMLAAGLVKDLTDYVNTDPDFDDGDFYEQIWQGAFWRDRIWFMPQAAVMPVLFYDLQTYRNAGMLEPTLRWTWQEMESQMSAILSVRPPAGDLIWAYLDGGLDTLYSYAFNWDNPCAGVESVRCLNPLGAADVTAALSWYSQRVGPAAEMPDLSDKSADERAFILLNTQGARREAAIWVDLPFNYEHQLLLSTIGVVPFPGSDRFDGITPLKVEGSFISQSSDHPRAVWEWLKYLSYQRPTTRLIPARPSVAHDMGFWTMLPRPLGNAMRTAFPFARPVTIEEKSLIHWEQLEAVASGRLTPFEAAQVRRPFIWFNLHNE